MITEDYVSFEVAKLLNEKGYCNISNTLYKENGEFVCYDVGLNNKSVSTTLGTFYEAPTHQMALKWLREVHNLCIEPYITAAGYLYTISNIPYGSYEASSQYDSDDEDSGQYITYEDAVEAAIKYCLTNLIK